MASPRASCAFHCCGAIIGHSEDRQRKDRSGDRRFQIEIFRTGEEFPGPIRRKFTPLKLRAQMALRKESKMKLLTLTAAASLVFAGLALAQDNPEQAPLYAPPAIQYDPNTLQYPIAPPPPPPVQNFPEGINVGPATIAPIFRPAPGVQATIHF
jgi:hypothetical protein